MKNCVPPLSGFPAPTTADTAPRVFFSAFRSASKHAEPAGAVGVGFRRVLRERIAALHDSLPHDAVEGRSDVGAILRVLDEVADVIRRRFWQQINDDRTEIGVDKGLLVPHLVERQRRRKELRSRRRLRGSRFRWRGLRGCARPSTIACIAQQRSMAEVTLRNALMGSGYYRLHKG